MVPAVISLIGRRITPLKKTNTVLKVSGTMFVLPHRHYLDSIARDDKEMKFRTLYLTWYQERHIKLHSILSSHTGKCLTSVLPTCLLKIY